MNGKKNEYPTYAGRITGHPVQHVRALFGNADSGGKTVCRGSLKGNKDLRSGK